MKEPDTEAPEGRPPPRTGPVQQSLEARVGDLDIAIREFKLWLKVLIPVAFGVAAFFAWKANTIQEALRQTEFRVSDLTNRVVEAETRLVQEKAVIATLASNAVREASVNLPGLVPLDLTNPDGEKVMKYFVRTDSNAIALVCLAGESGYSEMPVLVGRSVTHAGSKGVELLVYAYGAVKPRPGSRLNVALFQPGAVKVGEPVLLK